MDAVEALKQSVKDTIRRLKAEAVADAGAVAEYAEQRARHAASRRGDPDIAEIIRYEAVNVKAWAVQNIVSLADTADDAGWSELTGAMSVAAYSI